MVTGSAGGAAANNGAVNRTHAHEPASRFRTDIPLHWI
jgi:hypothetical protein